jgi:hypothetical protein
MGITPIKRAFIVGLVVLTSAAAAINGFAEEDSSFSITQIMDETSSLKNTESNSLNAQKQAGISSINDQAQATQNQEKQAEKAGSEMMAGAAVSMATSAVAVGASAKDQSSEQEEQGMETETSGSPHEHDVDHGGHR